MVNMMYTHGWLLDQQKKFFSPFGITSKQYNILRILAGAKKPLTTSQIRERMLDKMSDITRLINRMIKKGWVQKEICSTDRRLVDIVITDLGNQLLDQIEIHVSNMENILGHITEEEADTISNLLDKARGPDQ